MACVQGPCPTKLPDARDMRADHSHVPAIFQFSEWREAKPRTSKTWYFVLHVAAVTHGTPSLCRIGFALPFGPHFLLKTPRLFTGFGFLRLACVKSVRISISVCVCVCVHEEPLTA